MGQIGIVHYELNSVAEGKTKILYPVVGDERRVVILNKDAITGGDGAKRDEIPGKGAWCTTFTANAFRLLAECGLPAFMRRLSPVHALAPRCTMIRFEVVVRRENAGSFAKRHPWVKPGEVFPRLVYEVFLKTTGKMWDGHTLPVDDPLATMYGDGSLALWLPSVPLHAQREPLLVLQNDWPLSDRRHLLDAIEQYALRGFLVLEKAWQLLGGRLIDIKFEFGIDDTGTLVFADVITPDEHRLIWEGKHLDKQPYRDGAPLAEVAEVYATAAMLSERFGVPRQQVILWRASSRDDLAPFKQELDCVLGRGFVAQTVTASAHKEPERCVAELRDLVHAIPDSVVIAHVGRSNGLGPMLAANTMAPVITVPASVREFPDDVWSSLRAPSDVPVMTVLDPANAVQAALRILAQRSPYLYADTRFALEGRLRNSVPMM